MTSKEQVSALMDNELSQADLEALLSDQESQQTWAHFHMIGDTLRGETALVPQAFNLVDNIEAALNDEPAYGAHSDDELVADDQVTPLMESQPTASETRRQLPTWLANIAQVGMAACVTLVVILGMQQYGADSNTSPNAVPVLQTVPLAGVVEPVSLTSDAFQPQQSRASQANSNQAEAAAKYRKVNALMQDYELQRRLNASHK